MVPVLNPVEKTVPLEALSLRQQRAVAKHLPLVHVALKRMDVWAADARGERCDLVQEGCLALADAVRSHDPSRHCGFAAFALARVRYAISRYRHERQGLVRVPFKTQRRRMSREIDARDRHCPDPIPRVHAFGDLAATPMRRKRVRPDRHRLSANGVTVGEMIRQRYDLALARALDALEHSPDDRARALLSRCRDERWTIPESDVKTPLRQLARELECSLGKLTYCEERVRARVAYCLRHDRAYRVLRRMAHREPGGWNHQLTDQEARQLGCP